MGERLEKRVSGLGGVSRSDARGLIRAGRVAVGEVVVRDPAASVPDDASVSLDGRALIAPPELVIFHKPIGVQSMVGDGWGRESLAEAAAELLALGLHPVGRLDADTAGLLPFSRRGALTQRLLHPRHGVEKVYEATVEGTPDASLVERLAAGVATAEGVHTAVVRALEGPVITLAVTEGKHRMVRRMLNNAGFPVVSLRRIAFGAMALGELAPGAWRVASPEEAAWAASLG